MIATPPPTRSVNPGAPPITPSPSTPTPSPNAVTGSAAASAGCTDRSGATWYARCTATPPTADDAKNPDSPITTATTSAAEPSPSVSGSAATASPCRNTASTAKQAPAPAASTRACQRCPTPCRERTTAASTTATTTPQATTTPGEPAAASAAGRLSTTTSATPLTTSATPTTSRGLSHRCSRTASKPSAIISPRAITDCTTMTVPTDSADACRASATAPIAPEPSQRRSATRRRTRCTGPSCDATDDAATR